MRRIVDANRPELDFVNVRFLLGEPDAIPGGRWRLIYRGAPDSDHKDPGQNAAWLRGALDAALAGEAVAEPETRPRGCGVKWR